MRTAPVLFSAALIASVAAQEFYENDASFAELSAREAEAFAEPGLRSMWRKFRGKGRGGAQMAGGMDPSMGGGEQMQQRSIDFDDEEEFLNFVAREAGAEPGLRSMWRKFRGKGRGGAQMAGGMDPSMGGGEQMQQRSIDLDDEEFLNFVAREAEAEPGLRSMWRKFRGKGRGGAQMGGGMDPSMGGGGEQQMQRRDFELDDDELFDLMVREAEADAEAEPGLRSMWRKFRGKGRGGAQMAGGMDPSMGGGEQQMQRRDLAEVEYLEYLLSRRDLDDYEEILA